MEDEEWCMMPYCEAKLTFGVCAHGHRLCSACLQHLVAHFLESRDKLLLRCPKCHDLSLEEALWLVIQAGTPTPFHDERLEPTMCGCRPRRAECMVDRAKMAAVMRDVCSFREAGMCPEAAHLAIELIQALKSFERHNGKK